MSMSNVPQCKVVQCPLCGNLCPSAKMYISHLRLVHQEDPSFLVTCIFSGCSKTFRTFPAFNTHMYRLHRGLLGLKPKYGIGASDHEAQVDVPDEEVSISESTFEPDFPDINISHNETEINHDVHDASYGVERGFADQLEEAKFLLKLREDKQVSQSAINEIVKHCRRLCEQTHSSLVLRVKSILPLTIQQCTNTCTAQEDISRILEEIDGPPHDFFAGIDSSYLLESFARKYMNYIVSAWATDIKINAL